MIQDGIFIWSLRIVMERACNKRRTVKCDVKCLAFFALPFDSNGGYAIINFFAVNVFHLLCITDIAIYDKLLGSWADF